MDHGRISEQGTYSDLLQGGQGFSKLIQEFGSMQRTEDKAENDVEGKETKPERVKKIHAQGPKGTALMQEEDRETGTIAWSVYLVSRLARCGEIIALTSTYSVALRSIDG